MILALAKYFLNNFFGLGLQSNLYKSSHSVMATGQTTSGMVATGLLYDNISIFFIGPQVKMRFVNASTMNGFLIGGSIGYIKYTDNGGFITPAKLESETLGLNSDFDYDYRLSKSLSFGAGLSIKLGVLSSFTLTQGNQVQTIELDPDTYESLLRIDLSIGIRFH